MSIEEWRHGPDLKIENWLLNIEWFAMNNGTQLVTDRIIP